MKMPPWSYSGLTSFETCPKRYYHIKIAKDVIDAPGEAATWGSTVHKYIEDRLRDKTPLPTSVANLEALVAPIEAKPGRKLIEYQMAVDATLAPAPWDSAAAWCRGIVDVGVVAESSDKAVLLDWKTGKRKPDSDQLMLFAALAFAHIDTLNVVKTGFVWVKSGEFDGQTFKRTEAPVIWQRFAPRVKRLELAYESGSFPPRPSGLCRKHCPVPYKKCEFSGTK
jgi:hypothetical protein